MGLIDRVFGGAPTVTAFGRAATGMAEVFTQNATRRMELDEQAYARAIEQYGKEYQDVSNGVFNRFVNALNRLPRPFLAFGTLGLFAYSMFEPAGFALRMEGLQQVPEPLWWLLGAIVGFYFGAREAHYFRYRPQTSLRVRDISQTTADDDFSDNAALRDWAGRLRG